MAFRCSIYMVHPNTKTNIYLNSGESNEWAHQGVGKRNYFTELLLKFSFHFGKPFDVSFPL